MNNSDLSSTIAQGLQQEAITLAERLAARTDEPGLRRAAELLAILAAVPTVDLRPHLEWALKRISTSLGEGEHYAAALHALEGAQQPAAVAPIAGHADIFQAGYWLSHQQLRPAGSFDINPLCDELKSGGWSEAPVFVGMPTLQVTLARCNEDDLAALVKRLARALRKAKPGNEMSDQAMDYLKRQGLLGSPLRGAPTLEAPAHRCIRPQCDPEMCSDCSCAIAPTDEAAQIVLALLKDLAVDDLGNPFETGDHPVVDRARQWLQNRPAAAPQAPAAEVPASATLFEHEDGRHAVWQGAGSPTWTLGDPKWHRVGPVDVSGIVHAHLAAPTAVTRQAPGMAVQALAGEIVAALEADKKEGGYHLSTGVFGPKFTALIRRWAESEWAYITAPAATLLAAAPVLEAPAAPGAVLDLPSGAAFLGTYWNVYDGATFAWGSCDSGYFKLDQFGWATWPTQERFSRALLLAAAPQASDAPGIDQLLDALSQHDDPCDDIADALDRVRVLRAEVDRLKRAENARADAAAEVEIEWDVLPENAGERAMFDRNLDLLYGGDPRVFITTSLRLWANTAANGSFGAMCAVFANEVAKMHIAAPQVVQALEKARQAVAAIDAVGHYNEQDVILRTSVLDVFDIRSAIAQAN